MMRLSLIGVETTRCAPNSSRKPRYWPNRPPRATSSPSTQTRGIAPHLLQGGEARGLDQRDLGHLRASCGPGHAAQRAAGILHVLPGDGGIGPGGARAPRRAPPTSRHAHRPRSRRASSPPRLPPAGACAGAAIGSCAAGRLHLARRRARRRGRCWYGRSGGRWWRAAGAGRRRRAPPRPGAPRLRPPPRRRCRPPRCRARRALPPAPRRRAPAVTLSARVKAATPLSSQTNSTGRPNSAAQFSPSRKGPRLIAPSPKKQHDDGRRSRAASAPAPHPPRSGCRPPPRHSRPACRPRNPRCAWTRPCRGNARRRGRTAPPSCRRRPRPWPAHGHGRDGWR